MATESTAAKTASDVRALAHHGSAQDLYLAGFSYRRIVEILTSAGKTDEVQRWQALADKHHVAAEQLTDDQKYS
jgi:hypothetical protein